MNWIVKTVLIIVIPGLSACSRNANSDLENERILNAPKTRQDAATLMRSVDIESRKREWPRNVTEHFRRRMKGRLISAGMKEKEVDKWVESKIPIHSHVGRKARKE